MNIQTGCALPSGRCADNEFRLTVYEAGHALSARAMSLKIISVRMLPRPPMLVSDKTVAGNNINALVQTLENRVIELFGGQIAEEYICSSHSCCSGDVSRIDELARLIAGLTGVEDSDLVWFELEDQANKIFKSDKYKDAILPIAEFLYQKTREGAAVIDGAELEQELDKYVPPLDQKRGLSGFFGFGGKK